VLHLLADYLRVAVYCNVLQCVSAILSFKKILPNRALQCAATGMCVATLNVLQCVATLNVLQCVAVCCSVLQCVAVCCSVLWCVAVCCCRYACCSEVQCAAANLSFKLFLPSRALQCIAANTCVAVCCSLLQCDAICSCSAVQPIYLSSCCYQVVCCGMLQSVCETFCVAVCCSVLQCVASNLSFKLFLPSLGL